MSEIRKLMPMLQAEAAELNLEFVASQALLELARKSSVPPELKEAVITAIGRYRLVTGKDGVRHARIYLTDKCDANAAAVVLRHCTEAAVQAANDLQNVLDKFARN